MPQPNDLSRSLAALDQDSTLIAVIEMSQSSWLVAGMIPGVERHPLKKLEAERDGAAGAAASLARRGGEGGPHDRPHRGCLRGGPRRLLAGALAAGAAASRRM